MGSTRYITSAGELYRKDNSLSQIKRICYYLLGKNNHSFLEMMKKKYPDANNKGRWFFNKEDIWNEILNNKEMKPRIIGKNIENYFQLIEKTEEYCEKYELIS